MLIINLFCDASIDTNLKIACGGTHIIMQDRGQLIHLYDKLYIQHNATNNSAEILAIWIGVVEVLYLRQKYNNAIFRLFSDSKISLYGLRDWMKNWIKNAERNNSDILISSSGTEVANQQLFIDIFNLIVENNLKIELYHQRGHVGESSGVNLQKARVQFIKANKVSPENLGLDIQIISQCNKTIDNNTRNALRSYISNNNYGTDVVPIDPLYHYIRADMLPTYISNINKSSVVSRHDFKGGYNQ